MLPGRRKGSKQSCALWSFVLTFCNHNRFSSDMVEQGQMSTRKIATNENFEPWREVIKCYDFLIGCLYWKEVYKSVIHDLVLEWSLQSWYSNSYFKRYFKIFLMRFLSLFGHHLFDTSYFCILLLLGMFPSLEGTIMVTCNMPINFFPLGNSWEHFVYSQCQKTNPNQNSHPLI